MTLRQRLARTLGVAAAVAACAFVMGQVSAGRVSIRGNRPAGAAALVRAVEADRAMPLELTLVLGLRNQAGLEQLLAEQQNPASPHYRQWLTPKEFARRFGPTEPQIDAVSDWLKGQGFEVASVNRGARTIRARGDVETAERAFSTTLKSDGASFGNTSDPSIPAEFDGVVVSIMGLDNMHAAIPAGLHRVAPSPSNPESMKSKLETLALAGGVNDAQMPAITESGATAFGPGDVETFYDETPLLAAGAIGTGAPDCVAVAEDSDILPAADALYVSTFFKVAPAPVTPVYVDGGSPGINGDEIEALLDIEYSQAIAPGTPVHPYIGGSLYDAITQSVTDNVCGAISVSFIFCGESNSFYTGLDTLFAQAATQGQSVFIASGDWGAAGLQYNPGTKGCSTGTIRNPSEMATSPHVTAVGGTTFSPQYSGGDDISVVGVGAGGSESGWNASGGGASAIFPKPMWQTGLGVPHDNARDIPDVAMIAWTPLVFLGDDDNGTATIDCCWGGTSLSSPLWAGYSRVLAAVSHSTRLGLLNPAIYNIANAGLPSGGIEDVVNGNNTYNGVTGFAAVAGYDQITGWGSVDMALFASAFASGPHATPTPAASSDATATRTATPTVSATATAGVPTATATRTATATITATASRTATGTATATITGTATATVSATQTASTTATSTSTGTATATSSAAATPTATQTAATTKTPTATATATRSATATSTATVTQTATATRTATATATVSATLTATATSTSSATATATAIATSTATSSATPTATRTATATQTATATPTAVVTPVPVVLKFTPDKLKFGKFAIGVSSNAQAVTLSNPSKKKGVSITLESWSTSGDFVVSAGHTTCSWSTALSPGAKCTIGVVFQPTASGARSGKLTIEENASNNPLPITLKGTGK